MKRPMPIDERQHRLASLRIQRDALRAAELADAADPAAPPAPGQRVKKLDSRIRQAIDDLDLAARFDLASYDKVLVQLSGGKDSVACVLFLIDTMGTEWCRQHVELWHQDVDGGRRFMDWPVTTAYCRALAQHWGLPLLIQHREGGFEQELLRDGSTPTGVVYYDTLQGEQTHVPSAREKHIASLQRDIARAKRSATKAKRQAKLDSFLRGEYTVGKKNRVVLQWPALGDLSQGRWCSAYLKIMVCQAVLNNDPRFEGKRTLVVTGERWEESSNRSEYVEFATHGSNVDNARTVHQWRPVLDYTEMDIWAAMQAHGIVAHPAYYLGFGRVSCMFCIFGNADQFKTAALLDPHRFEKMVEYEKQFDHTVKGDVSLADLARKGVAYVMQPSVAAQAMSDWYDPRDVACDPSVWALPSGAFKECGGPS